MWYLEKMKENLTESDKRRLAKVFAPVVVGIQPDDSRRGLCVMPDGEIRHYGVEGKTHCWKQDGYSVYLASKNGLDWTRHEGPEGSAPVINMGVVQTGTVAMGAATRIPWSGRYVTLVSWRDGERKGTWAELSDIGPGDTNPKLVKISDTVFGDLFQPVPLIHKKRLIVTTYVVDSEYHPYVIVSDDDGESWKPIPLKSTPKHTPVYPHRGMRWQNNGAEPNMAELPDGRLMLLARTSLDYFYIYYSDDHGDTWTDGEPSIFHGTLTTPFLLRLSDGRILCFWNNARPLAEPNHDLTWPPVGNGVKNGFGEDAFTNRDVNHVAITSDGVNWTGFRELGLDEIRNASDFRVKGGSYTSADKSVHQFQALELPNNKILVAYGQNIASRRMAIFDLDWLYATERSEDFKLGLENVSTHMFVKSLSDSHLGRGFNGHCAWNRTDGALLIPDPDFTGGEVLQICRVHDERLVSERQGVVWNFPAMHKGTITLEIRVEGSGVHTRLCDHWINPSDEYAGLYAGYDFELDARVLTPGVWHTVTIAFDEAWATVCCGEKTLFTVPRRVETPTGLSYIHLQTMAEGCDFKGTLIRKIEAKA